MPTLRALLASVLTLSAVHCVDPAIQERGVLVPKEQPAAPDAGPTQGVPGGPSMKLDL